MPLQINGKVKQYIAIIYMLAATLFIIVDKVLPKSTVGETERTVALHTSQIKGLEIQMDALKESLLLNRQENREEHGTINQKLDSIIMQMKR